MLSINKAIVSNKVVCVPSDKTATYVCNRFNTPFCTRDHKTNQAISNLNLKF